MLICEMAAYYKEQNLNLIDVLGALYKKYGYYLCTQKSFVCEGQSGMRLIADTMERIRADAPRSIAGKDVITYKDFKTSVSVNYVTGKTENVDLPKSNVLGFYLSDGSLLIIRPSGTEPKIKLYACAVGEDEKAADQMRDRIIEDGTKILAI
jgi:phosphoglucomutase